MTGPWYVRRRDVERIADVSYGDAGDGEPPRRLPAPLPPHRRSGPGLLPRRWVRPWPEGPRGPATDLPAGQPGMDVHQRQLPASPGRLPGSPHRRQAGDRLGARSRERVRSGSGNAVRRRQLRRRPPGGDGRAHRQRSGLPTRLRGRRHGGDRGHPAVRLLRLVGRRTAVVADHACATGRATVLHPPGRPRHVQAGVRRTGPPLRGASARHRPTRSSTPSCRARSTPSTCSTRSGSTRSLPRSRRSPAGCARPASQRKGCAEADRRPRCDKQEATGDRSVRRRAIARSVRWQAVLVGRCRIPIHVEDEHDEGVVAE